MSRIGKNPVAVPEGVNVSVEGQVVKAKGPKGELQVIVHDDVSVKMVDGKVALEQRVNSLRAKKVWPTMRTLVKNIVNGVKDGYTESLEIQGVGYRCAMQGNTLVLQLGFSMKFVMMCQKALNWLLQTRQKLKSKVLTNKPLVKPPLKSVLSNAQNHTRAKAFATQANMSL